MLGLCGSREGHGSVWGRGHGAELSKGEWIESSYRSALYPVLSSLVSVQFYKLAKLCTVVFSPLISYLF